MTDDRQFTHPNLGKKIQLVQERNCVALIFHCDSEEKASSAADSLLQQLKSGMLNLTITGLPTFIEDE